jgi:hypothetical protein
MDFISFQRTDRQFGFRELVGILNRVVGLLYPIYGVERLVYAASRKAQPAMFVPATVAASGLARLALLLVRLALVPPAALDLLQHAGAHHLPPEPAEDGLLPLVLVHQDLHIVSLGRHHRRRRPARHVHHGRRRALPRERSEW